MGRKSPKPTKFILFGKFVDLSAIIEYLSAVRAAHT